MQTGVYPRFPRVKSYLARKMFESDHLAEWRCDGLPRVERFIKEGAGFQFDYMTPPQPPLLTYTIWTLAGDLHHYWLALRYAAIKNALGTGTDWFELWRRAAAVGYWKSTYNCAGYLLACQKNPDFRNQALDNFEFTVPPVATCLVLGWRDRAIRLAKIIDEVGEGFYSPVLWNYKSLTQHFVLRLVREWQGIPQGKTPDWMKAEPAFEALLKNWRTKDPEKVRPPLLAALDRHTWQTQNRSYAADSLPTSSDHYETTQAYEPYEVLAVMKLREMHGLENPAIKHILTSTPLGQLPPETPEYTEPLLDDIYQQAKKDNSYV